MTSHENTSPPIKPSAISGDAPHYHRVTAAQRAYRRSCGARNIAFGSIWLIAGLLITLITLVNETAIGFSVIAFGRVIGGVIQIASGVRAYNKGKL